MFDLVGAFPRSDPRDMGAACLDVYSASGNGDVSDGPVSGRSRQPQVSLQVMVLGIRCGMAANIDVRTCETPLRTCQRTVRPTMATGIVETAASANTLSAAKGTRGGATRGRERVAARNQWQLKWGSKRKATQPKAHFVGGRGLSLKHDVAARQLP